jgi:hypothetical protein
MMMDRDGIGNAQRSNYRLIIFIIYVGLCSLFVAETIRITVKTVDFLKYHTPLPGKLSGETAWEVDYVLISGQHISPDVLFASEVTPPQIKFGPLHDFKGSDGCGSFHRLFLDDGKGNITWGDTEDDRMACVVDGRPRSLLGITFERYLLKADRYELVPDQLRLYTPEFSAAIVFHPRSATSKMIELDHVVDAPLPRWECRGLPSIIIRYLGDRCYVF